MVRPWIPPPPHALQPKMEAGVAEKTSPGPVGHDLEKLITLHPVGAGVKTVMEGGPGTFLQPLCKQGSQPRFTPKSWGHTDTAPPAQLRDPVPPYSACPVPSPSAGTSLMLQSRPKNRSLRFISGDVGKETGEGGPGGSGCEAGAPTRINHTLACRQRPPSSRLELCRATCTREPHFCREHSDGAHG